MTNFHLLMHIFRYLNRHHIGVLEDMLQNFPDEKMNAQATYTLREIFNERYEAYFKISKGEK